MFCVPQIWIPAFFLSYNGPADLDTKVSRGPPDNLVEFFSSVAINVSVLPLKWELDGILDSDPSATPCAACFARFH